MSRRSRAATTGVLLALALNSGVMRGQAFAPATVPAGVIRSWGNDEMAGVLAAWQAGFRRYHPEVTFSQELYGTGTGMAGIITGSSDLSLMGRPVTVNEVIGFEWVHRFKPLQVQVLSGNLNAGTSLGKSASLAVLVAQENPIETITVKQLADVLGCNGGCGAGPLWGQAGATGAWAARPLHAYVPDTQTGTGAFLLQAVLGTGDRWNWSAVHEATDRPGVDGKVDPAGRQMVEALRKDANGMAIASLEFAGPGPGGRLKALRVEGVEPTPENVVAGRYPLARGVYVDLVRKPGTPIEPRVGEFLRFVLSPEGQALAAKEGTFLPLSAAAAAEQRRKLE